MGGAGLTGVLWLGLEAHPRALAPPRLGLAVRTGVQPEDQRTTRGAPGPYLQQAPTVLPTPAAWLQWAWSSEVSTLRRRCLRVSPSCMRGGPGVADAAAWCSVRPLFLLP